MRLGFLITARLKSSRLKLKLLKQLNGYSVIDRVIQRAKQVKECDEIILCTSENNQDLRLRIFNAVGEELLIDYLVEFTPKDTKQINLKNYDKGIYFLEIKITNKIINKKLILN